MAMVITPSTADTSPRATPPVPSRALTAVASTGSPGGDRRGGGDPLGMVGHVALRVLHHDAVAHERVALEAAFEHHGDAGLEQLGRVAVVDDGHLDVLAGDAEADVVAPGVDAAAHDRALDPEPPVAQRVPLGHGLVGGAEVEGGV